MSKKLVVLAPYQGQRGRALPGGVRSDVHPTLVVHAVHSCTLDAANHLPRPALALGKPDRKRLRRMYQMAPLHLAREEAVAETYWTASN